MGGGREKKGETFPALMQEVGTNLKMQPFNSCML
jgi:hypothetical protein